MRGAAWPPGQHAVAAARVRVRASASSWLSDAFGLSTLEYALLFIVIVVGALALWVRLGSTLASRVEQSESTLFATLEAAVLGSYTHTSSAERGHMAAVSASPSMSSSASPARPDAINPGTATASPSATTARVESTGQSLAPASAADTSWLAHPLGTGGKVAVVAGGAVAGVAVGAGLTWGTAYLSSLACGPGVAVCAGVVTAGLVGVGVYQLANGGWQTLAGSFGRVFSSGDATVSDALTVGSTLGAVAYGVSGGFGRGAAIARHGVQAGAATRQAIVDFAGPILSRGSPTLPADTSGAMPRTTSQTIVSQAAQSESSPGGLLAREYAESVAQAKGQTVQEVEAFYAQELAKGIDHRPLITQAMNATPGLTRAEAEAIYGYTCKQWYRDFNRTLEAGGSKDVENLSGLLKSGLSKMPSAGSTQYRGVRLDPSQLAKFDAEFAPGKIIETKSFWSTGPDPANAYPAPRNLIIKTTSAKDITELSFGKQFHGQIGKTPYTSETIIPPGVKLRVVDVNHGTVTLEQVP